MQEELMANEKQPLFEVCSERTANWSPAEDVAAEALGAAASTCKLNFFFVKCKQF